MTRLFILRHAKAASALPAMRDFDRPLDDDGKTAASALGKKMYDLGYKPDQIICSPSLRTRQTLEGLLGFFANPIPVEFEQHLYDGQWQNYLNAINNAHGCGSLLIVGHNPPCEEIVHQFVGSAEKTAMRTLLNGYAPGTLSVIDFEHALSTAQLRRGHLQDILLDGCIQ